MQPVTTVHGPVAAMQPVPLVQQPEQAQPQPSADTGHAASAPPSLPCSPPAPRARPSSLAGLPSLPEGARPTRLSQRPRPRLRLQQLRRSRPRHHGGRKHPAAATRRRRMHLPASRRPFTSGVTSCSRRPPDHSRIRRPPSRIG
jgi:hypothetical protein